jgi:hypothetical protein
MAKLVASKSSLPLLFMIPLRTQKSCPGTSPTPRGSLRAKLCRAATTLSRLSKRGWPTPCYGHGIANPSMVITSSEHSGWGRQASGKCSYVSACGGSDTIPDQALRLVRDRRRVRLRRRRHLARRRAYAVEPRLRPSLDNNTRRSLARWIPGPAQRHWAGIQGRHRVGW